MRTRWSCCTRGFPPPLIRRQLGHAYLSTTGTYMQGISSEEIISTIHARRAPMMHARAGLALYVAAGAHAALPPTIGRPGQRV
jgi:hypothetical protein